MLRAMAHGSALAAPSLDTAGKAFALGPTSKRRRLQMKASNDGRGLGALGTGRWWEWGDGVPTWRTMLEKRYGS